VLIVPDYQRGYAWEEKQWNDFLDDLEYLGDDKHHYTGTVVLDPQTQVVRDEEGRGNKVFHIVDGQQRLTTVVVLLENIRARVAKFNSTLATGIRKSYIEFRDLNQQRSYKLRLNGDSQAYFADSILTEPSGPEGPLIASHKRLKDAKAHFAKYLDGKEKAEGADFRKWIVRFYEKVIQQLRVSQYIVEESSEVGVIFEVMNNRGKPLSELDKAKNYLMYLASKLEVDERHDLADRINVTWAEIFRRLMANDLNSSADEDRLLRAPLADGLQPEPEGVVRQRFDQGEIQSKGVPRPTQEASGWVDWLREEFERRGRPVLRVLSPVTFRRIRVVP
jgi:uncharacterized protein with ParB-like and HNH nuclease domain